tara:strand:+ start:670 stop:906 length:237 start_codon:yes stop_codon:yes gene_type:complete
LAHVDVPTWLREDSWDKPVSIIKVLLFDHVLSFWLRKWTKEVRSEKVGLELIVSQIIRLNLKVWEYVWLRHREHYRAC